MRYPVNYIAPTNPFDKKTHRGVDFGWNSKNGGKNQPIYACESGKVIYKQVQTSGGKVIQIKHDNGYVTEYAHLDTWIVKKGDKVKRGQKIGTMGCSGKASGNHLHLGVYKGKKINYNDPSGWVDPIKVLLRTEDQKLSAGAKKNYAIKNAPYVTKTVVSKDGLNVRNKASVLGKKVGFLKPKEKVKVFETSGTWSRLDYVADEWVSSKYLK